MSWSPSARRNGVAGAVHLFGRQVWRESPYGPELERIVRSGLDDRDHVNRFHAAHAVRLLEPEPQIALALLRERLLTEPEPNVAAVLANQLAMFSRHATREIDAILEELVTSSVWQARLASTDRGHLDTVAPLISLTRIHG